MQAWIEDELRTVNLADERLNKRYRVLLERFSDKPTLSIPAACTGWPETQAAYRFCDNERVTPELAQSIRRAVESETGPVAYEYEGRFDPALFADTTKVGVAKAGAK